MGRSTDGILTYGYDLGNAGDGLNLANPPAWLADHHVVADFHTAVMRRLYGALADVPPAHPEWVSYQMQEIIKQRYAVDLVSHCSDEYQMWILAAWAVRANRGYPQRLDLAALDADRVREHFDGKLRRACEVLGFTPTWSDGTPVEPGWLLASDWS